MANILGQKKITLGNTVYNIARDMSENSDDNLVTEKAILSLVSDVDEWEKEIPYITVKDSQITDIGSTTKRFNDIHLVDENGTNFSVRGLASGQRRMRKNSALTPFTVSLSSTIVTLTSDISVSVFNIDSKILVGPKVLNIDILLLIGGPSTPNDIYVYVVEHNGSIELEASTTYQDTTVLYLLIDSGKTYISLPYLNTSENEISNIYKKFADQGLEYVSGFDINASSTAITIEAGKGKNVFQITDKSAFTDNKYYRINSSKETENFTNLANYPTTIDNGNSYVTEKYYSMVLCMTSSGPILVSPKGNYGQALYAEKDTKRYTNYAPLFISDKAIPLYRLIMKDRELQLFTTGLYYEDLRGLGSLGSSNNTSNVESGEYDNEILRWNSDELLWEKQTNLIIGSDNDMLFWNRYTSTNYSGKFLTMGQYNGNSKIISHDAYGTNLPLAIESSAISMNSPLTIQRVILQRLTSPSTISIESTGTSMNSTLTISTGGLQIKSIGSGGAWQGQNYFGNTTSGIVLGNLNGVPTIGGHNYGLSAWNDVNIGGGGITKILGDSIYMPGLDTESSVPLFVDVGTGHVGYYSSMKAHKININDITTEESLKILSLTPVKYNRRKYVDGVYTNEAKPSIEYGCIAEDTDVNFQLISNSKLMGVQYQKINIALLKVVQDQQKKIINMQGQIDILNSLINNIGSRLTVVEANV